MKHYEDNPMLQQNGRQRTIRREPTAVKVLFIIEIQSVNITTGHNLLSPITGIGGGGFNDYDTPADEVSVVFERGIKLAISSAVQVNLIPSVPISIEFDESLSLVTTLHRSGDGNYKKKIGKLIVRRSNGILMGGTGYTGIGLASLPLHRLCADFQSQQFHIPLTNNSNAVGRIEVVITSKLIGEVAADAVSDDEEDPTYSSVETADFNDSTISDATDKINPINESYQLALAAAMQSSKSCTSQAESLVHELESLQSKYDRAVEERKGFIALQGDHIRTLIASGHMHPQRQQLHETAEELLRLKRNAHGKREDEKFLDAEEREELLKLKRQVGMKNEKIEQMELELNQLKAIGIEIQLNYALEKREKAMKNEEEMKHLRKELREFRMSKERLEVEIYQSQGMTMELQQSKTKCKSLEKLIEQSTKEHAILLEQQSKTHTAIEQSNATSALLQKEVERLNSGAASEESRVSVELSVLTSKYEGMGVELERTKEGATTANATNEARMKEQLASYVMEKECTQAELVKAREVASATVCEIQSRLDILTAKLSHSDEKHFEDLRIHDENKNEMKALVASLSDQLKGSKEEEANSSVLILALQTATAAFKQDGEERLLAHEKEFFQLKIDNKLLVLELEESRVLVERKLEVATLESTTERQLARTEALRLSAQLAIEESRSREEVAVWSTKIDGLDCLLEATKAQLTAEEQRGRDYLEEQVNAWAEEKLALQQEQSDLLEREQEASGALINDLQHLNAHCENLERDVIDKEEQVKVACEALEREIEASRGLMNDLQHLNAHCELLEGQLLEMQKAQLIVEEQSGKDQLSAWEGENIARQEEMERVRAEAASEESRMRMELSILTSKYEGMGVELERTKEGATTANATNEARMKEQLASYVMEKEGLQGELEQSNAYSELLKNQIEILTAAETISQLSIQSERQESDARVEAMQHNAENSASLAKEVKKLKAQNDSMQLVMEQSKAVAIEKQYQSRNYCEELRKEIVDLNIVIAETRQQATIDSERLAEKEIEKSMTTLVDLQHLTTKCELLEGELIQSDALAINIQKEANAYCQSLELEIFNLKSVDTELQQSMSRELQTLKKRFESLERDKEKQLAQEQPVSGISLLNLEQSNVSFETVGEETKLAEEVVLLRGHIDELHRLLIEKDQQLLAYSVSLQEVKEESKTQLVEMHQQTLDKQSQSRTYCEELRKEIFDLNTVLSENQHQAIVVNSASLVDNSDYQQLQAYCESLEQQLEQQSHISLEKQQETNGHSILPQATTEQLDVSKIYCEKLEEEIRLLNTSMISSQDSASRCIFLERELEESKTALSDLHNNTKSYCESLESEVEQCRTNVVELEQWKKYYEGLEGEMDSSNEQRLSYQSEIEIATECNHDLRNQLQLANKKIEELQLNTFGTINHSMEISKLNDEINFYKNQSEEYYQKLQQGAEYVNSLHVQIKDANDETKRLNIAEDEIIANQQSKLDKIHYNYNENLKQSALLNSELEVKLNSVMNMNRENDNEVQISKNDYNELQLQFIKQSADLSAKSDELRILRNIYSVFTSARDELFQSEALLPPEKRMNIAELEKNVNELQAQFVDVKLTESDYDADQVLRSLIDSKLQAAVVSSNIDNERQINAKRIATFKAALKDANEKALLASQKKAPTLFSFFTRSEV